MNLCSHSLFMDRPRRHNVLEPTPSVPAFALRTIRAVTSSNRYLTTGAPAIAAARASTLVRISLTTLHPATWCATTTTTATDIAATPVGRHTSWTSQRLRAGAVTV